jgi:hypothetical protein
MPPAQDLLLVAETSIGCLDQILHLVPPESIAYTTLPVHITKLKATKTKEHSKVEWTVDENKAVQHFEVQKSYDGKQFTTSGTVKSTMKNNIENYTYTTGADETQQMYIRLKLVEKNNTVRYSKVVITVAENNIQPTHLLLLQNPVRHQLVLQFASVTDEASALSVYSMAGIKVKGETLKTQKGSNQIQLAVDALPAGTYIVQITGAHTVRTARFIKQ